MPLLPSEPAVFPEDLLTQPEENLPRGMSRWWVLHTKPRAEKSLARRLIASRSPFFLPLYSRTWRSGRRMQTSHLPLFPGYIFLLGDDQVRLMALQTNLVASTLWVEDQSELHGDLVRVHELIVSGAPLSPEERLEPGMRVEITSGPLTGLEGKVIRRGSRLQFYVEVNFLQRGASVQVEAWMMKPLDAAPALVASANGRH